jgi:hypothetical protein
MRRILPLLALFLLLPTAFAVYVLLRPLPEGMVISCVSYNAGNAGHPVPTAEQIEDVVMRRGKPDILFLQEISWKVKIPDLAERLGYQHIISGRQHPGWCNMAVFSRFPLSRRHALGSDTVMENRKDRGILLFTEAFIKGESYLLGTVHLASLGHDIREIVQKHSLPIQAKKILGILYDEVFHSNERSKSIDEIVHVLGEWNSSHVIIGGDFNTVPFSKAIRKFTKHYKDSFWPSFLYFSPTHKFFSLPINPRIDYIFHSDTLSAKSVGVLGETAGDHLAVYADIIVPYGVSGLGQVRGFVNKYLEEKDKP